VLEAKERTLAKAQMRHPGFKIIQKQNRKPEN